MKRSAIPVLFLAFAPAAAAGQVASLPARPAEEPRPHVRPTLEIRRAPGPIVLDGNLDDPGWVGAAKADGFTEFNPGDRIPPPVRTEVLVTYDDRRLYIAFIAHGDPAAIRATFTDRDRIFDDDFVGVLLDTYGDASWAYFLMVNPLGIQGDERFTNDGEDDGFDVVYESEGRITETGYQVEMAIPFASLRFPQRPEQVWRINFIRNYPRSTRHQLSWAALNRDDPCTLCQSGTLRGITGVRPGGQLELLPALVASQSGARVDPNDSRSEFDNRGVEADASIGIRYPFSSGWTAELTINPDFSQVESDAAQIDVNTTFALSYPERRPFFQEGSDLFDTRFNAVYTRSINDPVVAAKLTGRMGRTSVAYIGARDERSAIVLPFEERSAILEGGRSTSNILRIRRNFGNDSYVAGLLTDRRLEGGGSGTVVGADGQIRLGGPYRIDWQVLASHTAEADAPGISESIAGITFDGGRHTAALDGESYWGRAAHAALRRSARLWSFAVEYQEASPTFRADNGFETRNAFREIELETELDFYKVNPFIDEVRVGIEAVRGWNFDGVRKEDEIRPDLFVRLKGQTYVYLSHIFETERFRGVDLRGMRRWEAEVGSDFSRLVSLGISATRGDEIARTLETPRIGTGTGISAWATLKPTQRLEVSPSYSYEALDLGDGTELYAGYIVRTRVSYQFTREFFLRLVGQFDDFDGALDVEPLLMYRMNPFSILYLGSTHGFRKPDGPGRLTQADRQFFLKLQYLFRR
jgi:hypothetical protein